MRSHYAVVGLAWATIGASGACSKVDVLEARLAWEQAAGRETVECRSFKLDNDEAFDIGRFKVEFGDGSHHIHLYRAETPEPDGVVPCEAGIDWMRWRLLVAVQTEPLDWRLPDGVGAPIAPHQQLMAQVHWINATTAPTQPTIAMRFDRAPRATEKMGALLGVSQDVAMTAGERKTVSGWLSVPGGARLVRAMGHYHDRGYRFSAARVVDELEGAPFYESLGKDNFEFASLESEPPIDPSETIAYRCDFENDTGGAVKFGADTRSEEHCNFALYYHPAAANAAGVVLNGGMRSVMLAGNEVVVELSRAAGPAGTEVWLSVEPPDRLELPARVRVPPWQDRVSVSGRVLASGAVTVSATTGANSVEATATLE